MDAISLTAQFVKGDILLESWLPFVQRASLKESATRRSSYTNSVCGSARLLKSGVSVLKTLIQQVIVNTIDSVGSLDNILLTVGV